MNAFWKIGFHNISMGDLVRETGVSRAGIYSDFANKRALFHASIDLYEEAQIKPLFATVEETGAGIKGIRTYLDTLLTRFDANPDVGVGCLVGNTFTQLTHDDDETHARIVKFYANRVCGYRKALTFENELKKRLTEAEIDDLADYVMISIQGLWSYSRLTKNSLVLRQYCDTLTAFLELRLCKD